MTIGSNSHSTYDATLDEWTEVSADAYENFHAVEDDGFGSAVREDIGNTATVDVSRKPVRPMAISSVLRVFRLI